MAEKTERNEDIIKLRRRGVVYREIAQRHHISIDRCRQIFEKWLRMQSYAKRKEAEEYRPPSYDDIYQLVACITSREGRRPAYDVDEVTAAIVTNLTGRYCQPRPKPPRRLSVKSTQQMRDHFQVTLDIPLHQTSWVLMRNPLDPSLEPIRVREGDVVLDTRGLIPVFLKAEKKQQ